MADEKLTALTEETSPEAEDLTYLVNDPSGTPGSRKVTLQSLSESTLFNLASMFRQALINGNFDIWQRNTTFTNPAHGDYTADRWIVRNALGTPPANIVNSRQALTPGDIQGADWFYRIVPDGEGTPAANDYYGIDQIIENGVRYLNGDGKYLTISFWARSSNAGRKIGTFLELSYGSGGSPSTVERLTGDAFTLTTSWQKFTHTIAMSTLAGKTFGTNRDDVISLRLWCNWNTTWDERFGESSSQGFTTSETIDIAQVQINAGETALAFQPQSYADELNRCRRYYIKFISETAYQSWGVGAGVNTNTVNIPIIFPVEMRTTPTLVTTGTASNYGINSGSGTVANSAIPSLSDHKGKYGADLYFTSTGNITAEQFYLCQANNTVGAYLAFSAEL